jgi:hypothetical protein
MPIVEPVADTPSFVRWAIRQLGLDVTRHGTIFRLVVPEDSAVAAAFAAERQIAFTFDRRDAEGVTSADQPSDTPQWMAPDTPLFERLMAQVRTAGQTASGGVVHTRPEGQPIRVGQISARLFSAYRVDAGGVHLAGCTLEDHPLVRVTYRTGCASGNRLRHIFVGADGEALARETVVALCLDELVPLRGRPPGVPAEELGRMVAVARQRAAACLATTEAGGPTDCILTTLVWCPFAAGKLRFTVGTSAAELPFRGWAGALVAPPFVCPETGASGYHLAATDDGRISVADQIAVCGESGRRVLSSDLVQCSVTGQRVLWELTETCPVSGRRALPRAMITCGSCHQRVSTAALDGGEVCTACQNLAPIPLDDPRIRRIIERFPTLAHWRGWRLAETAAVHVVHAARRMRRLLLVVDRDSLEPLYLARGNRLSSTWTAIDPDQYADVLGVPIPGQEDGGQQRQ